MYICSNTEILTEALRACFDVCVVKFLIIAGPYEADLVRRAALASDCEALAIEAGDSLSGWVAASRPDAIVVTSRAVKAKVTEIIGIKVKRTEILEILIQGFLTLMLSMKIVIWDLRDNVG